MADLVPGYTAARDAAGRRVPGFQGVLRRTPHSQPSWQCADRHLVSPAAVRCAAGELERRGQGRRAVFTLLHCEPCDRWLPDAGQAACPACAVPLERLKLAVLERVPGALTPGSEEH